METSERIVLISIIIPMRNEKDFVARCLDSVLAQISGREDVEILCVDGASTDGTAKIVEAYAARDPRIRLLQNPDKIVPRAMNLAIGLARGQIIVRLDCHAEYNLGYIDKCVEVLTRTGADNAGGYITTLPGSDTAVGRAIAAASSSRFGVGGSTFRTGGGREQEVDCVPFGCFRRDVFERFGLYDERLVRNQDLELNSRIRTCGGRIIISPEIQATYYTRSTFAGLRQQAFNNGLWNPYTVYLVGGGLRPRHLAPLAFVLSMCGLLIAGVFWWPAWVLLGMELVAYTLVGSWFAFRSAGPARAPAALVFLAFLQLHLAYGIGSLWGLISAPFVFGFSRSRAPRPVADRRA